jgi:hypothetical protein
LTGIASHPKTVELITGDELSVANASGRKAPAIELNSISLRVIMGISEPASIS